MHNTPHRLCVAIILPLLLLVFPACTSPRQQAAERPFEPDDGIVVLRLVNGMDKWWARLYLNAVSPEAKDTMLSAIAFADESSSVFVGRLKAGTYGFGDMTSQIIDGSYYDAPLASRLPHFRVEAGKVTNLGTIVLLPTGEVEYVVKKLLGKTTMEGYTFEVFPQPDPAPAAEVVAALYPQFQAKTEGTAPGWESPPKPGSQALLQVTKKAVIDFKGFNMTSQGEVYAGGRFGLVLYRAKLTDPWKTFDTGAINQILAVLPLDGGRILAGGEEGAVMLSEDKGKTWQRIDVVPVSQKVIALHRAPKGDLFLVAQDLDTTVVYSSREPARGWTEVQRIPRKTFLPLGDIHSLSPVAANASHLVVYGEGGLFANLDFAAGKWETATSKLNDLNAIGLTSDGLLYGVRRQYMGNLIFYSKDYGATWYHRTGFALASIPIFRDSNTGYMTARPRGYNPWTFVKTNDGGSDWTEGVETTYVGDGGKKAPIEYKRFYLDPTGKIIVGDYGGRRLLLSHDEGVTWEGPY